MGELKVGDFVTLKPDLVPGEKYFLDDPKHRSDYSLYLSTMKFKGTKQVWKISEGGRVQFEEFGYYYTPSMLDKYDPNKIEVGDFVMLRDYLEDGKGYGIPPCRDTYIQNAMSFAGVREVVKKTESEKLKLKGMDNWNYTPEMLTKVTYCGDGEEDADFDPNHICPVGINWENQDILDAEEYLDERGMRGEEAFDKIFWRFKYCPLCGKKIDWKLIVGFDPEEEE